MKDLGFIVFIVFIVAFVSTGISCSHYKSEAKELKQKIKDNEKEHAIEAEKLTAMAAIITANFKAAEAKAAKEYADEINAIHIHYGNNVKYVDRMHHTAEKTIEYLPTATRSEVEKVAVTRTNEVVECAALLTEVDGIAREYSAEIDYLIESQPVDILKQLDKEPDPHRLE